MHALFTFHMVQQYANIHLHEGLVQCTMYMNAYIRFIHFTWYSNVLILTSMKDFLHFIWYSNVLISTSMKDSYMQALPASCWISSTCLAFTGSKSSIPNLREFIFNNGRAENGQLYYKIKLKLDRSQEEYYSEKKATSICTVGRCWQGSWWRGRMARESKPSVY